MILSTCNLRRSIIGVLLLGLLAVPALMPVWLPWAARPLLSAVGVDYAGYERQGYRRLGLRGLEFTVGDIVLTAERVEAATPPVWLWRRFRDRADPTPLVAIMDWHVLVPPATPADPGQPQPPTTVDELLERVEKIVPVVDQWLSVATAANGVVQVGDQRLDIERMDWRQRTLALSFTYPPHLVDVRLQVELPAATGDAPLAKAALTDANHHVEAELAVRRSDDQVQVEGFVQWQLNRILLTADFGRQGWLPERATASAESLRMTHPKLAEAGYAGMDGAMSLRWVAGGYTLDLTARAQPTMDGLPSRPPIQVAVQATGDLAGARLEQASVSMPGIDLRLSAPLALEFRPFSFADADFDFAVDLAHWPQSPVAGEVAGTLCLTPVDAGWPPLAFTVESPRLTVADEHRIEQVRAHGRLTWPAEKTPARLPGLTIEATAAALTLAGQAFTDARMAGDVDWPWITLTTFTARQGDGATVDARAKLDWPAGEVESFVLSAEGVDASDWLPKGFACQSVSLTVQGEGRLPLVTHRGELVVEGLHGAKLPATRLAANWRGEGLRLHEYALRAANLAWALEADGSLVVDTQQVQGTCERLAITRDRQPVAQLVDSSRFSLAWGDTAAGLQIELRDWHWQSAAGELTLNGACQWPRQGELRVGIRGLDLSYWLPLLPQPWRGVHIDSGELVGSWDDGPASFHCIATARWTDAETRHLRLDVDVFGDAAGMRLETVKLADVSGSALTIDGRLPLTVEPALGAELLVWRDDAPLNLEASFSGAPQLWEQVAEWSGVRLHQPEGRLSISGTPANPQGRFTATAAAVEIQRRDLVLPKVEGVRLEALVAADRLTLAELAATVEGHPIQISGHLPLNDDFWRRRARPDTWPTMEQATARILIADAKVADFARFLPAALSPQGRLSLDVRLLPGLKLAGELHLTDAATRAFLPIGPIRQIDAHFRFVDRRAEIVRLEANWAGETVSVDGYVAWPAFLHPEFSLRVRGQRVPLARQPGLILRADLDLTLTMEAEGATKLAGVVGLRDSFYLTEWRSLLPGQPMSPARRPPFFSVTEEPFAHWLLDVRIEGERGLRVRTPLFRGELTPALRLAGTLAEPIAIGEVRILDGGVQFPFATIDIVQGHIALASDNPYRPELFIVGTSRAFDYDLRLQVSGFADQPIWEMSATPPLAPEAIILLVTAGEIPHDTVTFSDRQRAGRLLFFVGRGLLSELWLDESTADRLVIRSGETVARDGRETLSIEYRFTERWSLVGEYDEYNDINVGIKWLIYSK